MHHACAKFRKKKRLRPALLQKLVGDFLNFAQGNLREFWRDLFGPAKKGLKNVGGNFGAFFMGNFVARKYNFMQTSFCRSATLKKPHVCNFLPTIFGLEMAASILWAPGIFVVLSTGKPSMPMKFLVLGGGGALGFFLGGGGGAADLIFMGAGIFLKNGACSHTFGGSPKGGFQRVVLADVPWYQNPERGYIRMLLGTKTRNEGTFAKTTLLRNHQVVSSRHTCEFIIFCVFLCFFLQKWPATKRWFVQKRAGSVFCVMHHLIFPPCARHRSLSVLFRLGVNTPRSNPTLAATMHPRKLEENPSIDRNGGETTHKNKKKHPN